MPRGRGLPETSCESKPSGFPNQCSQTKAFCAGEKLFDLCRRKLAEDHQLAYAGHGNSLSSRDRGEARKVAGTELAGPPLNFGHSRQDLFLRARFCCRCRDDLRVMERAED